MAYDVSGMDHKEMVGLVRRRLNKLAMCKRGIVATDINKMREKLGKTPCYTAVERVALTKKSSSIIKKAMTPTIAQVTKYSADLNGLTHMLLVKARKATAGLYVHPKLAKYTKDMAILKDQENARIGSLDADFQDVEDEYILGVKGIIELPVDLLNLEQREW